MDSIEFHTAPKKVADLLAGDRSMLVYPVGTSGYRLPALEQVEVLTLSNELKHDFITVSEHVGGTGNMLVLAPQCRPFKLKVGLAYKASNNIVVLGRDSAAHAELDIRGRDGVMIIGERAEWPAIFYARFSSTDEFLYWGAHSKSNGVRIIIEGARRSVIVG